MADKVLPQRVSAALVREEGAELLEGGGASVLPSQGSQGDEVPTRRRISLSRLLPARHFCSVPNQPGRFPSLPLGWWERFEVCTKIGQAGLWASKEQRWLGVETPGGP